MDDVFQLASAQPTRIETDAARSLLDQLLTDSRLYTQSKDYKDLLDFVIRLRNFAPFNAMLLQVQKPGLRFAASAGDWRDRFDRRPMEGARPLLILWPFGPVALVYDVQDTEGKELAQDAIACFFAQGPIDQDRIFAFIDLMRRKCVECLPVDAGDGRAGSIRVIQRAANPKEKTSYRMLLNRNHDPAIQFATIAHELAHLHLGHLGPDKALTIPERASMGHAQKELEAESVSHLVCARSKVMSKSQTYLSKYVTETTAIDNIDIYQVMRAAGQVEALLGLTAHTTYDKHSRVPSSRLTNG
jgi:IrrE N-terminal-like domain